MIKFFTLLELEKLEDVGGMHKTPEEAEIEEAEIIKENEVIRQKNLAYLSSILKTNVEDPTILSDDSSNNIALQDFGFHERIHTNRIGIVGEIKVGNKMLPIYCIQPIDWLTFHSASANDRSDQLYFVINGLNLRLSTTNNNKQEDLPAREIMAYEEMKKALTEKGIEFSEPYASSSGQETDRGHLILQYTESVSLPNPV